MIEALFIDLDNTLFPTDSIPADVVQPVIDSLLAANRGTDAVSLVTLYCAIDDCWRRPFDLVAQHYGLSPRLREAWTRASQALRVTSPLVPYDDVAGLATLPVRRFLVTSGYRGYQESKIAALGIAHLFEQVLIDTLGEPDRPGKERLFQDVAQRHGWHPRQVLVVGDSAESEITAGNRLGMPTVQVLRPGVDRSPLARYWVAGLGELAGLVERMESSEE